MTVAVVQPDHDIAVDCRSHEIQIAVVVDVSLDNADDRSVKLNRG